MSIPELGPLLGNLTAPAGRDGAMAELDRVRLAMVGVLFERTAAARTLLKEGDEAGARGRIGAPAWIEIWEDAARRSAATLVRRMEHDLREAALVSRYPGKRLAAELPTPDERAVLAARLAAAGLGLEASAPGLEQPSAQWAPSLRRAAGELDQAWHRLMELAGAELAIWQAKARRVEQWRRPWWPLLVGLTAGLALAVWSGLVLGGYLPVPGVLRPVAEWFWDLPWP